MSKIDGIIADLEAVIDKLGGVNNRLKELKEETEAIEKARDKLRSHKTPKKSNKTH